MAIMFTEIELFSTYVNFNSSRSSFLAQAAYTVYIIHPWIVACVTRAALATFGANGTHFDGFPPVALECPWGTSIQWAAWAVSALVIQLIVWPLAFYVRKLPGLREIL